MSVLPQVVVRNWRLKLSAMALAVFLWAVVTVQPRNRQVFQSVPVQVAVADPGWALADGPSPALVTITLGGPTRELLQLPREPAVVRLPIDRVSSADTLVRIRSEWVILQAGPGVIVENISPPSVALRLEPALTATLPLAVRTRNEFPEDVALAQQLGLNPMAVRVRGPTRVVENLDSIPLEPLDLSRVAESGLYRVRVDTTDLGSITVEPATAQIAVNLQPMEERAIAMVPVLPEVPAGVDPLSLVVQPSVIQVTLRGARTPVGQASAEALSAVVAAADLEGLGAGTEWTVPIRIRGVPPLVRAFSTVDSVRVFRTLTPPAPPLPGDTLLPDTLTAPPTLPDTLTAPPTPPDTVGLGRAGSGGAPVPTPFEVVPGSGWW